MDRMKNAAQQAQQGITPNAGGSRYALEVRVEGNAEPYDATVTQYIPESIAPSCAPGSRWQAKADPGDRAKLLLYGQA